MSSFSSDTVERAGPHGQGKPAVPPVKPEMTSGLRVRKHHGIWQVRVDGVFHGDYHQEDPARAAAARLGRSQP